MSLFSYLYQLKTKLYVFFQLKNNAVDKQKKTKYALEATAEDRNNLKIKCNKAAQEIKYLKSFTHWPMAKAKLDLKNNSLVYLDTSRYKRSALNQNMRGTDPVIKSNDKVELNKNVVVIKKFP